MNENEWSIIIVTNGAESYKYNVKEKPDTKVYVLFDCIYIKDKTCQTNLCFSRSG